MKGSLDKKISPLLELPEEAEGDETTIFDP